MCNSFEAIVRKGNANAIQTLICSKVKNVNEIHKCTTKRTPIVGTDPNRCQLMHQRMAIQTHLSDTQT